MLAATVRGRTILLHQRRVFTGSLASVLVVVFAMSGTAVATGKSRDNQTTRPTRPISGSSPTHDGDGQRSLRSEHGLVHDGLSEAFQLGKISGATYALNRAVALFHPEVVERRFGYMSEPDPREATLVLRDLVAKYGQLSPAERITADSLLARPTDGASDPIQDGYTVTEAPPVCGTNACFHYVTSTGDAPPPTDTNTNGFPDWIDSTAAAFDVVWAKEVTQYGYRPPKSDMTSANHGPDGRIDVYLADVGAHGLYGYCATDDPNAFDLNYPYFDASGFCVVDNDMSPSQFQGGTTGIPALEVTLAHEFFHAVQCAYDCFEDRWFSEGTATWMEDEVFDGVNDNRQYLRTSQLNQPFVPLDFSDLQYSYVYGAWIWFRFLSEYFGNPTIIRQAWENADGSSVGQDQYSLQAIASAITARNSRFRWAYADFGAWNDVPRFAYSEGDSYPVPPYERRHRITVAKSVQTGRLVMSHLTQSYVGFLPRSGVTPTAKLLVAVNLPAYRSGSEATAVTVSSNGRPKYFPIHLNQKGDGSVKVPFGRGKIDVVDLVITNGSTRTSCWLDDALTYSCAGAPKDDRLANLYGASLLQ
jgi:hypothetical protein